MYSCMSVIPLQLGQNTSDTVSPLDKLLLERQVECLLMLNNTLPSSAITTTPAGKCRISLVDGQEMYEGCCSKKPYAIIISAVCVEFFLTAGGKVAILTEDQ